MSKLIITGATGTAGFAVHLAALADPSIPSWADLPSNASEKSRMIIVKDFTQYPEDSISGFSEEEYMKIHVDFPLAAVEALKKSGVGSAEKPFNFLYLSGQGSDPSQKSMFMYSRGKGRAETELTKALDTPTTKLLIPRPGYFFPAHAGQRQHQQSSIGRSIDTILGSLFTNTNMGVSTEALGSFLVEGAKGSFPNVSLADNAQIKQLLKNLQKQ
ncbi:hypothetical protein BDM02DRAFT_3156287 [Thelephora ganbajun]|uniref:Uncharacterized protein n=1 Tax=Thelephora ganbajun TaxID=370292 RepID=A0ACB6ZBU4_THEGA|nr:hypothetical protein BDM02DRAFT_3156287 [Thelephora ganbajun]